MKHKLSKSKFFSGLVFWICLSLTAILCVVGFLLPPQGVIDGSVLEAGALFFGYATLNRATQLIREHYNITLSKGDVTLSVTKEE
ncbi:MAG: hypothetical protein MJZ08_02410 [Bacteroidaceae bacterium]|nr:hypothetical protein [Bacteroidaceae bacterium]